MCLSGTNAPIDIMNNTWTDERKSMTVPILKLFTQTNMCNILTYGSFSLLARMWPVGGQLPIPGLTPTGSLMTCLCTV